MNAQPTLFAPDALRAYACGDEALFRELLAIFLRIAPPMAARLRQALADANARGIADEAHSLKSSLALIGAEGTSAQCAHIELAARRGGLEHMDTEGAALCEELDQLIDQVRIYYAAQIAG